MDNRAVRASLRKFKTNTETKKWCCIWTRFSFLLILTHAQKSKSPYYIDVESKYCPKQTRHITTANRTKTMINLVRFARVTFDICLSMSIKIQLQPKRITRKKKNRNNLRLANKNNEKDSHWKCELWVRWIKILALNRNEVSSSKYTTQIIRREYSKLLFKPDERQLVGAMKIYMVLMSRKYIRPKPNAHYLRSHNLFLSFLHPDGVWFYSGFFF